VSRPPVLCLTIAVTVPDLTAVSAIEQLLGARGHLSAPTTAEYDGGDGQGDVQLSKHGYQGILGLLLKGKALSMMSVLVI
jgi:hypothetical protein